MEFAAAPLPVEQVYATLQATLSYDAGVRGPAEAQLREWEGDAQPGFIGSLLKVVADASPIRRNVTIEDVGNVAAFLLSDLSAGVTAEITYVDGGYNKTMGVVTE